MFVAALFFSLWLVAPLAVAYSLVFFAPELIVFGVLIDAYFGFGNAVPVYVIGASLIVVVSELLKPHLSFYST